MSLTGQLSPGHDLHQWCVQTFPGTADLVSRVVGAARRAEAPVRPEGRVTGEHWAEVGGAFGQRLADLVDPAPPYAALLGMVHASWLTWDQAHAQAASYPSHAHLDSEQQARGLSMRRTPDGWMDLGPTHDNRRVDPAAAAVLIDLLERTRAYQATFAPAGDVATPGVEAGLARSAWVLAACEGIHRSGQVDPRLAAVLRAGGTATDLRAIPTEPVVEELVALVRRLRTSRVLAQLRANADHPAPGRPLGVAAPTLVPGWADGDLLVGTAAETTLIDVKTVISVSDPDRVGRWLWQILGYAWLDTHDLHRIRSVGLYLARHGALLSWGLNTFAGQLLGDLDTDLRHRTHEQFLDLARRVIHAEGGRFPIA
ncbi:MAG: hypothetical protein ABIQ18_15280 [Umezawaea sp.]